MGRSTKAYPESIRSFCLQIHFHSPAAYSYIRKAFNNNLPRVATLIEWYSSIEGAPGFNTQNYAVLRKKVVEYSAQGKELFVSLISDEMAINQKLQWDNNRKRFIGFATCENSNKKTPDNYETHTPLGKQALVFMVVSDDFKLPLSYFLLNGISAEDRKNLTLGVINRINETEAKIMAFISDGCVSNISCAKLLGADFDNEKPYFFDPAEPTRKIYVIWDACHMLKLARNCLASKQLYHNGQRLNWEFIVRLYNLQCRSVVNFGNKLNQKHMNYQNMKMNVRIATQTLSNSVASSLEQVSNDGVEGFEDCGATIEYIRMNNNLFDILNTKPSGKCDQNFKMPMSPSTKCRFFEFFDYAKTYMKGLKMEETKKSKKGHTTVMNSVFATRSYTAFFGHYNNIIAFEGLYKDYVENGPLDELYTFKFSQDHLETFFGTIRRINGQYINSLPFSFTFQYTMLKI